MLVIVDNGRGADEISRLIRMQHTVIKPSEIKSAKATAYILSDGDMKNINQNVKFIKRTEKPILGIGAGYIFLGSAFGANTKEAKFEKQERIKIERPCPLVLDLKKMFTVLKSCKNIFGSLPENFDVIASSQKYDFEIIQDCEKPFFGTQFNPELGADGFKILNNFEKFVEVWEKYHKW
jgi:GMP synthase (glutamine-hydrolysing)